MDIKDLQKTKKEQVLDTIKEIHYEHRHDAGAMMGTLTASEGKGTYVRLLNALDTIPDLSEEERDELRREIQTRIENIPNVEKEKDDEFEENKRIYDEAFNEAKARFAALSPIKQVQLRMKKKDPDSLDYAFMRLDEIKGLYRSEER